MMIMPWEAFEFSATENKLILNVDKEKLKAAPGFEKGDKMGRFQGHTLGRDHLQLLQLHSPLEVVGSRIRVCLSRNPNAQAPSEVLPIFIL